MAQTKTTRAYGNHEEGYICTICGDIYEAFAFASACCDEQKRSN